MKVKVSWRDCKKYDYTDHIGCPLYHTLLKLGVPIDSVGSNDVSMRDGTLLPIMNKDWSFPNDHSQWFSPTVEWAARRHRSVYAEVEGLEKYLPTRRVPAKEIKVLTGVVE